MNRDSITRERHGVRRSRARRNHSREVGFTLVEVLIVVSIIAILAGLVVVGVQIAREKANKSVATVTVNEFATALDRFEQDEGTLPGVELDSNPERNDFPLLFNALFGEKRPKGPGGRNAPYSTLKEDNVVVLDRDTDTYRKPTRDERLDPQVKKFIKDPWGEPYVYRANKGKDLREDKFRQNPRFDIYTKGPDEIDQTMLGEGDQGDDIGNW